MAAGSKGELKLDISHVKPNLAILMSDKILEMGFPHFLSNVLSQYTQNKHLIETAKYMSKIFSQGKLHVPRGDDLTRTHLVDNVNEVYALALNHFNWENGHTTEQTAEEVAAYLVARARLENLKSLWVTK